MLSIIATVWTALGGNKLLPWLLLTGLAVLLLAGIYLSASKSGATSEKLRRATESLNSQYREVQRRADIQATRTDVARDRLRQRWGS